MSAKTEIPGVNNAVEKLLELEDRMRTDDFGFKTNDVNNIDQVIDALYELEGERKKIHEELEKETIQSSILRHQLRILPGHIRDEVMEAVMAARESNANVILELQEKLKTMNNNIIALDKAARELEQENAKLQPERELLKQQHEEIISQLNQRMAEKASLQIALNETRDKVRQANQDIVDLEDGILQLKEDLIQERTEARQEKKRLKKAVTDTTQKTREQKDQNVTKKMELDIAQEKLMDSEGKLDAVRKSIRRYETSRAKLEGEERALAAQLSEQLKMNDQMRIRGAEIMNNRIEEERSFKTKQQELLESIKQLEEDIVTEGARSSELQKKKVALLVDLREKEETMGEDAEKVQELDDQLQVAKEGLNIKAEEVGSMQTENVVMSDQIEALAESHKAVLAQLNKQIEEYRELLAKEKKERLEVQAQKEGISKELDDLKTENQFFMTEMTTVVQDAKKKHQDLSNEGMQLQKTLKADEEEIHEMEESLEHIQSQYQTMFDVFTKRTQSMECLVERMENVVEKTGLEDEGLEFQQELVRDLTDEIKTKLPKVSQKRMSRAKSIPKEGMMPHRLQKVRGVPAQEERGTPQTPDLEGGTLLQEEGTPMLLGSVISKGSTPEGSTSEWGTSQGGTPEEGTPQRGQGSKRPPWDEHQMRLKLGLVKKLRTLDAKQVLQLRDEVEKGFHLWEAYRANFMSEEEKAEVLALEANLDEKKNQQNERTPVFEQLEVYFDQRTLEYNTMKKDIVAMKNKKQGLEEEIKRKKKDKEALKIPQDQMRRDLRLKRSMFMDQMKHQTKSTNEMEENILSAGCKLRSVVEENHKFEESCRKLEEQLADLERQMEENERIRQKLEEELKRQKDELLKKWEADNMMQEFFASRDEATAEAFGRLLSRTHKRENKIDLITERLKEELSFLGGFLDTISTRRPEEKKRKVRIQGGRGKHQSRQGGRSRSRSQSRERNKSRDSGHSGSESEGDSKWPEQQPSSSRRSPQRARSKEQTFITPRHSAKPPLNK